VIVVAALGVSAVASATFPGRNGRIAFTEGTDIFTMNPDGSDVRQLTTVGPDFMACCGGWSPDGKQYVFAVNTPDFSSIQLWITNTDGSNQHLLFDDPSYFDVLPTFAPDGGHVVFSHCIQTTFQCGVFRIRVDGTDLTQITGFGPDPDVEDLDPAYSPDGATIAFTSSARGGIYNAVYLMDADGSNIRLLTPPVLGADRPDWSPSQTEIAFVTSGFQGAPPCVPNPAIWLIDPDDAQTAQLTGSSRYLDVAVSWSPQGDAIVFERDTPDGQTSIYVMNMGQIGGAPILIHEGSSPRRPGSAPAGPASGRNQARSHRLKAIEQGGGIPKWGTAN